VSQSEPRFHRSERGKRAAPRLPTLPFPIGPTIEIVGGLRVNSSPSIANELERSLAPGVASDGRFFPCSDAMNSRTLASASAASRPPVMFFANAGAASADALLRALFAVSSKPRSYSARLVAAINPAGLSVGQRGVARTRLCSDEGRGISGLFSNRFTVSMRKLPQQKSLVISRAVPADRRTRRSFAAG
jgi:hypothetical protein